jgi:hypothetical protein
MITIFSNTNVTIKILHNLALFWVKNANFVAEFFGENNLKIITSVTLDEANIFFRWKNVYLQNW